VRLGEAGALSGDLDFAPGFDGARGEMSATAQMTTAELTMEGWFDWRAGVAVMRDHNSVANRGWILAYARNGALTCRVAGTDFDTGRPVASLQGAWHHVALTLRADGVASCYVDGQAAKTGAVTVPISADRKPVMPWHVMRNGDSSQFSRGRADEIAVYPRALSVTEIAEHFRIGRTGG
jgi:hypothetical protein